MKCIQNIIQPYSGTVSHLRSCPVTVFVFTRPSGIVNSPIIICYFRAPPLLSLCFAGFEEERSELSPLFAAVNNKLKASGREKKETVFAETRSVREAKLFDPRQISRHACRAPGSVSLHSAILSHYKITNTNAQSIFLSKNRPWFRIIGSQKYETMHMSGRGITLGGITESFKRF